MRKLVLLTSLFSTHAAFADPAVYKKSGPDKEDVTVFWVKCENGNVSTAQCLKDVSHCGAGRTQSLMSAAVQACDGIQGLTMVPSK